MMKIDIITLFPDMFDSPFAESIVRRASKKGIIQINTHNLRDFATDKHRTVDDKPYGGSGDGVEARTSLQGNQENKIKK